MHHLNGVLRDKLDTMTEAVAREFGASAECWAPKGGIFLWIKLPDAVDVRKLVKPAAEAGIVFNAGPDWAVSADNSSNCLRLCFAMPDRQTIRDGVAELARVCHEQTGIPVRSGNLPRLTAADTSDRPGQTLRHPLRQQGMPHCRRVQIVEEQIPALRRTGRGQNTVAAGQIAGPNRLRHIGQTEPLRI